MSSITLHPRLGVNPRLTYCPRCGRDTQELLLLGNRNWKLVCNCGCSNYGATSKDDCGSCKTRLWNAKKVELTDQERLPASNVCTECDQELKEHAEIVKNGGAYFRCKTCRVQGVIKADSELAKEIRKTHPAPKPVGFEFDTCEQHGPLEDPEALQKQMEDAEEGYGLPH